MKQKKYRKALVVAGVLAISLCLTGCYIPPDEISDGTQNMTVGSNSFPFDTVQLTTDTPTPTPTNTPTPTPPNNNSGTINNPWATDDWSTTNAPQGGITTNAATQSHPIIRVVPLFIKDVVVRSFYSRVQDRNSSAGLTNMGPLFVPEDMRIVV